MKGRVAEGECAGPARGPHSLRRRLFWFAACVALGIGVGSAGLRFTGDAAWFLAVPALLAVGWLVFADPTQCQPGRRPGPGKDPDR